MLNTTTRAITHVAIAKAEAGNVAALVNAYIAATRLSVEINAWQDAFTIEVDAHTAFTRCAYAAFDVTTTKS